MNPDNIRKPMMSATTYVGKEGTDATTAAQRKLVKLAEKEFKRQQTAANGSQLTAAQWKKKKNRRKMAKKSRKNR